MVVVVVAAAAWSLPAMANMTSPSFASTSLMSSVVISLSSGAGVGGGDVDGETSGEGEEIRISPST